MTPSYSAAETVHALKLARQEAERIHGPLVKRPFLVTDNGSSFLARRFAAFVRDQFSHVRIQYRTPQQLGLLERFHQTLKTEEVYWRLYDHPQHCRECLAEFRARYNERRPHWALVPAEGGDVLVPADVYVAGPNDPDSALAGLGPGGTGEVGQDDGGGRVRRTSCRDFAGLVPSDQGAHCRPWTPASLFSCCVKKETKIVIEVSHKISPTDST